MHRLAVFLTAFLGGSARRQQNLAVSLNGDIQGPKRVHLLHGAKVESLKTKLDGFPAATIDKPAVESKQGAGGYFTTFWAEKWDTPELVLPGQWGVDNPGWFSLPDYFWKKRFSRPTEGSWRYHAKVRPFGLVYELNDQVSIAATHEDLHFATNGAWHTNKTKLDCKRKNDALIFLIDAPYNTWFVNGLVEEEDTTAKHQHFNGCQAMNKQIFSSGELCPSVSFSMFQELVQRDCLDQFVMLDPQPHMTLRGIVENSLEHGPKAVYAKKLSIRNPKNHTEIEKAKEWLDNGGKFRSSGWGILRSAVNLISG